MHDAPLYPRGFAFHPDSSAAPQTLPTEAFERLDLPGGALLDVDELTDRDISSDGSAWAAVIGLALLFDPISGTVATEGLAEAFLSAAQEDPQELREVEKLLYETGGRYCLLLHLQGQTRVYHDAHGSRTVYWRTDSGTVSSHFDILERLHPTAENTHPLSKLTIGARWEHTRDLNIRALLPNHRLELEDRQERRFFPLRSNPFMGWTADERVHEIGRIWHAQLDAVLGLGRPNVMSVTAGTDSRLLLSFVRGREDRFDAFTYGPPPGTPQNSSFNRSLTLDLTRATPLAEAMGLRHRVLHFNRDPSEQIDDELLDRNSVHAHGRHILPLYMKSFPDRRTLFYRGNLVETVRSFYNLPPRTDWRKGVETSMLGRSRRTMTSRELKNAVQAIREELKRFSDPAISGDYQAPDLAYWEVRMGRLMSEIANETDVAFDVWMPINQRRLLDLFLAFPFAERRDESSMFRVIDREYPMLNRFDLNSLPSMETRARLYEAEKPLVEGGRGRAADRQIWRGPAGEEAEHLPDGLMSLDEHTYVAGSSLRREWDFDAAKGSARLVFRNQWTSRRGAGYMRIAVGLGDRTLHTVDHAESALAELVRIPSVTRGEKVWVELRPLRTINVDSWFQASKTEVLAYSESADDS